MNRATGILAGLYVLLGIAGFLPGVFLLFASAMALAWWGLALRTATPPVGFDRFLEGAQVAALEAFPDFPLGVAGLGLLALHCLLSIPNLFGGFALARGKPGVRERILRLGALNLVAFPVGTALGIATIWALNRPEATDVRPPASLPSMGERQQAALCYLVPVLIPLYLLFVARPKAYARLHAIQSLALYVAYLVAVNLFDAMASLLGLAPSNVVTWATTLLFILLAAVAYGGNAPALPLLRELAERWQAGPGALVERAIAIAEEAADLERHRRGLAAGDAQPAKEVLPKVAGTPGPQGFTQRSGRTVDVFHIFAMVVAALPIGFLVWKLVGDIGRKGAASINWAIAIPGLLAFGGFGAFLFFLLGRSVLASRMNGGELAVARWPLRLGDESRVRFKGTSRPGAKVERIAASLRCVETVPYRDRENKTRTTSLLVRSLPFPEVTPLPGADGSANAEWTLRVPRDAAPSFMGSGGYLTWEFVVEMRIAGAPDSTLTFDVLVLPEEAAP